MQFFSLASLALLVAACGGTSTETSVPDGRAADARELDARAPDLLSVEIHARGAALVAIRGGDGAWTPLAVDADGVARADVARGPYDVASVCDVPGFRNIAVERRGPTDEPIVTAPCALDLVRVKIPAGVVTAIGRVQGYGGTLSVRPGTYDVVSVDLDGPIARGVIQRGIVIAQDTTLTVDYSTAATLAPVEVAMTTLEPTESVERALDITTRAGTTLRIPEVRSVWRFPADALVAGDRQEVRGIAATPSGGLLVRTRTATRELAADATAIELQLPPALTSTEVTWANGPVATWQVDGTWQEIYLIAAGGDASLFWTVRVAPGWLAANGPISSLAMPDLTGVPGWSASWNLAMPTGIGWELRVRGHDAAGQRLETSRAGNYGASARAAD